MAFLDHIENCNRHDLGAFTPWYIDTARAGWIHHDFEPVLAQRRDLFQRRPRGWQLADTLTTPATRTAAVESFLLDLRERGLVRGWRGEHYAVTPRLDLAPTMTMERAAVALFGVRAFGVHMTGFVRARDGLHIWVPRRSRTKETYPGMLDNTVAGGQPACLSLYDNMIKECGEEAGIPPAMARNVRATGFVSYVHQAGMELKPDIEYCFDLELPADFVPKPADGEAESFELWPAQRVIETVRDTDEFKFNCNLVLIDFFVRHGLLPIDTPGWFEIVTGLRRHVHGLP